MKSSNNAVQNHTAVTALDVITLLFLSLFFFWMRIFCPPYMLELCALSINADIELVSFPHHINICSFDLLFKQTDPHHL